ncbi:MAG: DUF5011 domain-containing protein [Firmicutes bacterium]|nr:DUF5011 domain-containing protein [Bacillota bacterium]
MAQKVRKKKRFKVILILLIIFILGGGGFAFYYFTTPQISLKGESDMEVTMKDGYQEPGAEATFSFHDISSHIKIDASEVNDKKVGTYTVTYTVDYLDKTASETRTVRVVDKEPPEITLEGGDSITVQTMSKFEDPGAKAVDDSDGDVTDQITSKGIVDTSNRGDYTIRYTVTDSYGNKAKATRKVTVDGEPAREVKGVIYLTFDDGPSSTVTPKILKTLEKYDVPATFFVIGYDSDPDKIKLMKRAIKDGCTIGIHGKSHDYGKIYTSTSAFMKNINSLGKDLKRDLDYDAFVIRFPGGSSNTVSKEYSDGIMTKLVKKVQAQGYYYNDWNVDSTDASGNGIPVDTIIQSVKDGCSKDGYNVVLMHDTDAKGTTAKALPKIIKWGKKKGYKFKAITPDSPMVHHGVNN